MYSVKELRAKLKKLNGLQWTKKRALRRVVATQASAQKRLHKNKVMSPEGHPGAAYVPERAVQLFYGMNRHISDITKDMNARRMEIRQLESQVQQILMSMSKEAYFTHPGEETIFGLFAVGFKGPKGEFYQEEIWANNYVKDGDGFLVMKGGSMRVHGPFEEVVESMLTSGGTQVEGKHRPMASEGR